MIAATDDAGREYGVVVKFGHKMVERGEVGLVAEAIAAMFARDLGLNVPAPYAVRISAEFVSSIPDVTVAPDFQKAMPVTFGSQQLDGISLVSSPPQVPPACLAKAGDVFAFDAIVDNPDRRPDNPNCCWMGDDFVLIDHELTFSFTRLFYKDPWIEGALEFCKTAPHVLFDEVRGKNLNFARLLAALQQVTPVRCDQYIAALPPEWQTDYQQQVKRMVDYIRALVANAPAAISEVRRVLQ